MANKKFHITPDGPKKCTATFRPCRYSNHYHSVESAFAAEQLIQKNQIHEEKVNRLKRNKMNFEPDFYIRSGFTFAKNNDSMRRFAEELDARKAQLNAVPEMHHSGGTFRLQNGSRNPIEITLLRTAEIDESEAKLASVWRVNTRTTLGIALGREKVNQEVALNFRNENSFNRSMIALHEVFRNGAIMSGIREDDEAEAKAEEMTKQFLQMYDAVESEATGEFALWEQGQGYFKDSDPSTIVVDVDYRRSAFRGQNVRNFLKDNLYYAQSTPDAKITVTDHNEINGSSWAIHKLDGEWSVERTNSDGSSADVLVKSPEDVYSHVYWAVKEQINPDDEKEARRKARYASQLMKDVEAALDENKASVSDEWAAEHKVDEARRAALAKGKAPKEFFV
jgi:hypothetical protein